MIARTELARRIAGLARAGVAIAAIAIVGSVIVPLAPSWLCRLGEHFRPQYVAFGAVVIAAAAALRSATAGSSVTSVRIISRC